MSNDNKKTESIEIIDLSILENKEQLLNSEYILAIMEICINSSKYHLTHSNCTRAFWDNVTTHEQLGSILRMFKAETLRKYWRIIRDSNQHDQMIIIIKAYAEIINNPCYKVLPIINSIIDFIKSKETEFDKYLLKLNKSKIDNNNKKKKEEQDTFILLNNKRKPDNIIEIKTNKPEVLQVNNISLGEKNKNINQNEDNEITLKEIIETMNEHFPNKNEEDIYQALYKMSGDIKQAFLYLCNPDKYHNLTFVSTDDYIIQHLRNKSYYDKLVISKGQEKIKERERFLNIKFETETHI